MKCNSIDVNEYIIGLNVICGQAKPSTQTILSVIILPVESRWCKCLFLGSTNDGNRIGLSGISGIKH